MKSMARWGLILDHFLVFALLRGKPFADLAALEAPGRDQRLRRPGPQSGCSGALVREVGARGAAGDPPLAGQHPPQSFECRPGPRRGPGCQTSPGALRRGARVLLSLLIFCQGNLRSETVSVTSYYPSPLGVYKNLRVTENVYLGVNSGTGVGIGTTAITYGKLDLIAADDYGAYLELDGTGQTNAYGLYSDVSGATNNFSFYGAAGDLYVAEQVGIGTASPTSNSKLDIRNTGSGSGTGYGLYSSVASYATNWSIYSAAGLNYFADNVAIGTANSGSTVAKLLIRQDSTNNILDLSDSGTKVMVVEDGGRVGIGTTDPSAQLHVYDTISDDEPLVYLYSNIDNDGETLKVYNVGDGNTAGYFYSGATGVLQIGLYGGAAGGTTNKGGYFYASGGAATNYGVDTSVTDTSGGTSYGVKGSATNIGSAGTTYGLYGSGSGGATNYGLYVAAGYGYMECDGAWTDMGTYQRCTDLAEIYKLGEPMEPGDVVVYKRDSANRLYKSAGPYDEFLAGVYSSYPGMILGTRGEGESKSGITLGGAAKLDKDEFPLALVGRVPVKVTDENGKIEPGDRLTSSSKPGHAMKAIRAGRVLGIALESFGGREGKVLIMVNPQWWDGGEVAKLSEKVSRLGDENESLKLRLDKLEKKLAEK
ncbi:MAG: hypothetical protein HY547_10385 [Elusimicrobia bacterium]|nr:hypothetical protein [Elusimicrobiota bacterium]